MKFGVQSPNCLAGMMYPVPFATAKDVVGIAVEAEQLGYYDVGGNDHLSTQQYVRDAWPAPPDYFEPLVTLSNIAARTSVLRLTTGILVLPMRQPVLAAKQIATLDNLSDGRLMVGAAAGGYRDEFEAVCPDMKDQSRAELTYEGMRALRVLFEDARATFRGKHFHFEDVESFPKPVQTPFPIYSGGNADGSLRRAAELCQGWFPSKLGPDQIRQKRAVLDGYARAAGRDPAQITTALGSVVCIGDTPGQARETLENSAFGLFKASLETTTTKGVDMDRYADINLVGTPGQVCEKVAAFEAAGVEHLCSLEFVGNTVEEMASQIRRFARDVIPAFPDKA
jgi:probable F420-dependent oxidoreductase